MGDQVQGKGSVGIKKREAEDRVLLNNLTGREI